MEPNHRDRQVSINSALPSDLRQRAEEALDAERSRRSPANAASLSPDEVRRALHELQVHEIELEMQNEELRRSQAELEAARLHYVELYESAPVGHLTVSGKGLVLECNGTAADLLGVESAELVGQPISRFILPDDQDLYYRHRGRLYKSGDPEACELRLRRKGASSFWARMQSTLRRDDLEERACHIALSDVSEERQRVADLRFHVTFMRSNTRLLAGRMSGVVNVVERLSAALAAESGADAVAHAFGKSAQLIDAAALFNLAELAKLAAADSETLEDMVGALWPMGEGAPTRGHRASDGE